MSRSSKRTAALVSLINYYFAGQNKRATNHYNPWPLMAVLSLEITVMVDFAGALQVIDLTNT